LVFRIPYDNPRAADAPTVTVTADHEAPLVSTRAMVAPVESRYSTPTVTPAPPMSARASESGLMLTGNPGSLTLAYPDERLQVMTLPTEIV